MRTFLRAAVFAAAVGLLAVPTAAHALMIAFKPPVQRAVSSDVVVVGKVTAVGADDVEATFPYVGAKDKAKYKVATVKVTEGLVGVGKDTTIKVGFIPPAKPVAPQPGVVRPPIRRGPPAPELKEGQELILFLAKHPTADFYVIPNMNPPVDVKDEQGKKELEAIKKVTAAVADPMKGLKSDKADVRSETAVALLAKYRSYPALGGEVEQVAIPAEESKLILKGLAEAEWSNNFRPGPAAGLNAMQAFYSLGLNEKDKWVQPIVAPQPPGAPPVDFAAIQKDAFVKWLDGPGKNYVVKKNVPKAATEK